MAQMLDYEVKITINETERSLLQSLSLELDGKGSAAVVPAVVFCRRLGYSVPTVRRSFRSLARKGLISMRSCTRADGSRDANEYRITVVGWLVLSEKGRPRRARDKR